MNNILKINGVSAVINYDPEIEMFHGSFTGLNGVANFYAQDVATLKAEGAAALADFLETCQAEGIKPYRAHSGKFQTRTEPEKHALLEQIALAKGESMNQLVNEGISYVIAQYAPHAHH